ncbi:uncharacterized protein RCC_09109 [Ramularia collo-cygni]|uniref:Uncharacterized protein n=1 Tax=Ramularia collo-cygni TaxID=112498 RepID=A0A2D3V1X4_9PEZI|nr:uncharacterized protein RCC_09109 [Ramularia collo-cygni]CZT23396.1 uncharacterized protein RCC_09109 [Ramularia collo-cygni]
MRRGGAIALRRATHATSPAASTPFACSSRELHSTADVPQTAKVSPSSRWLSDIKNRIGYCITFGLKPAQTVEAGSILDEISRDWRELLAGSEGYLTDKKRLSMLRRPVAWGDMDSMGHGK